VVSWLTRRPLGPAQPTEVPLAERGPAWLVTLAIGLTVLPFAVSAVALAAGDIHLSGDLALTEMRTRDVGSHTPLLGPYSRDGWFHPGPALFLFLALPYRLTGSSSFGLLLGALAVNAGSIVAMALLARRRGGVPALLTTLLVCGILVNALGFEFLESPWNPFVTVLPLGVLVLLVWSMACGDRWALPVAAMVATFQAQTHVGNVVLGVPLVAAGAVALVVADRRARRPPRGLLTTVGLTAALVVLAWSPTAIDELSNEPGNVSETITWFSEAGDRAHSLGDGWNVVSASFELVPEWLTGARLGLEWEPDSLYDPPLPVLLVPVALAAVVAWRRPSGQAMRRLFAVWLLASVLAVVAVARTVDAVYAYRTTPTWLLGALAVAAAGWVAWTEVTRRWPRAERRALLPGALAALAVLGIVNSVAAATTDQPAATMAENLAVLVPVVLDSLPEGDGQVVVRGGSFGAVGYQSGIALQLERRGIDARLIGVAYGDHRAPGSGPVRTTLRVAVDADVLALMDSPEWTLVGVAGPRTIDELRAREALLLELRERIEQGERIPEEAIREAAALGGQSVAVFRPASG
jgi:hypothetical protein